MTSSQELPTLRGCPTSMGFSTTWTEPMRPSMLSIQPLNSSEYSLGTCLTSNLSKSSQIDTPTVSLVLCILKLFHGQDLDSLICHQSQGITTECSPPTTNGGCQHFCLLGQNRQAVCKCSMGFTLNPDRRTCASKIPVASI